MNTGEEVAKAAQAVLQARRLALASYVRTEGRNGVHGWFRTIIDRDAHVAVMANNEQGSVDLFLTVSVGDREFIAVPDGASERSWMVRRLDPGERPDTGLDAVLWLLGACGAAEEKSDGSLVVALDRHRALAAAPDSAWAAHALSEMPDAGRARVWSRGGRIVKLLLDLPKSKSPKQLATQRLVSLLDESMVPALELAPGSGEREVEELVADLLSDWPGGQPSGAPPPGAELRLVD